MVDGEQDPIWAILKEKLPWHKNPEELQKRKDIWRSFDVNGNGYLSLAEIDKACRDVLQLPQLFDMKPVLMRAFMAAKNKVKSKSKHGDDYVTKGEFRWLLKFLRMYFELWVAFDRIDTSGDRRVSYSEFCAAIPDLERWNIDMSNPEAQWKVADRDGGGMILFIEFCSWAIKNNLDLDDDDDDDENE